MKKILFIFSLLFPLVLSLDAQVTVTPNTPQVVTDNENEFEIPNDGMLLNLDSNEVTITWEITVLEAPVGWEFYVLDPYLSHFPGVTESAFPVTLAPNGTGIYNVYLFPDGIVGCGRVFVELTNVEEPDVVIDTAYYDFLVNTSQDCLDNITSSSNQSLTDDFLDIKVFPNPVKHTFNISLPANIQHSPDYYQLLDVTGRVIKEGSWSTGQAIDIEHLAAGIYQLRLFADRELLGRKPIIKG